MYIYICIYIYMYLHTCTHIYAHICSRQVAYSSLSSFPFSLQPHEDPIIRHIANTKHNSDDDQGNDHKEAIVVLRWILQQGIAVIPRTAKLDKLASNMQAGGVYLFLILFLIIVYRNHIYIYIYIYLYTYVHICTYICMRKQ